MNKIITLSNVGYKIDDYNFIKNLNLDFHSCENVLISSNDSMISNLMIDLITGFTKPQIGNVTTKPFDEKRYFIGYKNFESALKYGALVQDIINTLVYSQRNLVNDENEVNELISLFSLENILNKSTSDLTEDQLFLLNLIMLLIVKPRIIILKKLPLLGSTNFQLSALKYIYNYTKKYSISLIVTIDNEAIMENLIDRKLKIENGKVVSDVWKSTVANYENNMVNNKTMKFDLDDVFNDFDESFNESNDNETNDHFSDYNKTSTTNTFTNKTKQIEIDIPLNNSKTKTVKIDFDEHLGNYDSSLVDDIQDHNIQATNSFKKTNTFIPQDSNSIKFNISALENDEEINELGNSITMGETQSEMITKKLTNITKEFELILTDDTNDFSDEHIDSKIEIVEEKISETFDLKQVLDAQVKDPEFLNLSINLQSQILDNLERVNEILENDFKNITTKLNDNNSITRMIINENYTTNGIDDNNRTSIIDEDNQDHTKTNSNLDSGVERDNSDLFYYDNEKPNSLYDLWKKKIKNKSNSQTKQFNKVHTQTTNDINPTINIDEQIDNFTTNLNLEDETEVNYKHDHYLTDDFKEVDVPSSEFTQTKQGAMSHIDTFLDLGINNIDYYTRIMSNNEPTKELLDEMQNIEINSKTGVFSINQNNINDTKNSNIEIETWKTKKRNKLNTIEKLYQEALQDLSIVEEQKNINKSN